MSNHPKSKEIAALRTRLDFVKTMFPAEYAAAKLAHLRVIYGLDAKPTPKECYGPSPQGQRQGQHLPLPAGEIKGYSVLRYLSPDCPPGYNTVLGWLATNDPERLDLMDQDAEATQRDGWWLMHRADEWGAKVVKVSACPFLVEQGIDTVNAYPDGLLAERFA